jgi:hypothetical protein
MNIQEFAKMLDGREYGREITEEEEKQAKELGFVVVFGASDDLTEFRGAIDDELDSYNGRTIYLDGIGIFEDCEAGCKHCNKARENCKTIEAEWCEGAYSWSYCTNIPHATFEIMEDEEKYCKGIVFEFKELG